MTRQNVVRTLCTCALVVLSLSACAKNLKNDAEVFCRSFDQSVWAGSEGDAASALQKVAAYQIENLKNPALQAKINAIDTNNVALYAQRVRGVIEEAIGDAWDCPAFDAFFLPSQTVIPLHLGAPETKRIDPNSDAVLLITITYQGEVLIDNAPVSSDGLKKIDQAVLARLKGRSIADTHVVLYLDEGAPSDYLSRILKALSALNVKQVDLLHLE